MGYEFKIIFISFAISFILLFPIGVFLAINFLNKQPLQQVSGGFKFLIPKEQDLNCLFVNCNDNNGRMLIDVILIFKISAHDNSVSLVNIDSNIKTIAQNKVESLQQFFNYGGVDILKEAIENFLNIKIDRTIQATDEAIQGAINCLGGLKIDENSNLEFNHKLPIVNNKKIVGGNLFINLLKQKPIETFSMLKYGFLPNTNLNRFFAYFANMVTSNISAYDFELRKKGFEQLIESGNANLILPNLKVINFKNRHKLTDFSKNECLVAFSK